MAYFDQFLEVHSLTTERAFTAAELSAMKNAGVPEVTVGLLERFGFANASQRYFTVNPLEHAALLDAWGVDSTRCFVFMRSALGALFASMDDDKILCLDAQQGVSNVVEGEIAPLYVAMDMFSLNNLLDEKGAAPPARSQMVTLTPPLSKAKVFDKCKTEVVDFVEESMRLAELRQGKLKSYEGVPKRKAAPGQAKATPHASANPKDQSAATKVEGIRFPDRALQLFVVANLWKQGLLGEDVITEALEPIGNRGDDLDEDEKIDAALEALSQLPLPSKVTSKLDSLAFVLDFEIFFERLIGVETGGEADYKDLRSLDGISALAKLESLDLRNLSLPYGPELDLAPLAKHPALKTIMLGVGAIKSVKSLATISTLERLGVPHGIDVPPDLPKKLAPLVVRVDDCG
ncbi:hypothetical protein AKJ09_06176 [Labilithrix luteola]|uniref:DUF6892 domain-containing protein n=1 Tax=Labilithrix luteola TaxID=1391654 RepID=A0A0K1Q195_9BACT|nr:hypothetical protein [Labilithrix luteola]AKU99512.1 hypothetical protein AKJ09_06176 [Labilithrix luteola]